MKTRRRLPPPLWGIALLGVALGSACDRGADLPGREIFELRCSRCHSVETPLSRRKDRAGWERTVWAMRQRGARLTDEEAAEVVRYLAAVRGR
jgi:hypothetical protein